MPAARSFIDALESLNRRFPAARWLLPVNARKSIHSRIFAAVVRWYPDRIFLQRRIFRALAQARLHRILFVGVERYNRRYPAYFDRMGMEFWTIDIKPENACWGSPRYHLVADASAPLTRYFESGFFDCAIYNGVFGFGLDAPEAIEAAINSAADLLYTGAFLIIGWNCDKTGDPMELAVVRRSFALATICTVPAISAFPGSTHRYTILRRT
jgi:hypothetical protein